ncbi:unnamed protein product [Symbiodinium microadriaticum]|nr:unnamed protein product [Symbiodinium microadriaticum]
MNEALAVQKIQQRWQKVSIKKAEVGYPEPATEQKQTPVLSLSARLEFMDMDAVTELLREKENEVKLVKKRIATLKALKKGQDITVNLLQPSGRMTPQTVKPKDTVLQAKKKIDASLSVGDTDTLRLIYGNEEMTNNRTLHGYGVADGDVITMVLAIRGGGKTGVIKQNFMKLAKRTQAVSLMENRTGGQRDAVVSQCIDACNALMQLADNSSREALRRLLVENSAETLGKCIAELKASNNKDARLEGCANYLFEGITKPIRDRIADYNGAIESTHCVFQMMMNDVFCPNGKWDWKGFEGMVSDIKNDKDRANLAQASAPAPHAPTDVPM